MRISVPGRGAPAGRGASLASSASPISQYVTATVDSVGPYVFATMACGKRSRSAAAVAWRNASPQKRKSFTLGSMLSENEGSTRHKSANEGVETHTDMSDFDKSANNERVSAVSSWETACRRPPVESAPTNSYSERSNEYGGWSRNTWPPSRTTGNVRTHCMKLHTLFAEISIPFGLPVEPDVKMIYCVSSPLTHVSLAGASQPENASISATGSEKPDISSTRSVAT